MDFDEYEYLEKTVEEQEKEAALESEKKEDVAKSERSYRKRDGDEAVGDDERRSSKRSKGDDSNGDRKEREREKDRDRRRSSKDDDRERERRREKDRERERSKGEKDGERDKDRDMEKGRSRDRGDEKEERERDREKRERRDREKERERDRELEEKERSRRSSSKSRRHEERERERELEEKERSRRSSSRSRRHEERERERELEEKERARRSSSRSRRHEERERERSRGRDLEFEGRDGRRFKDKKDAAEPEADPERDQRTVFAYQMPLKATERDVYEFFSKAGKVRDVRLIMDRNSRRSKGVGYIEFYDVMSVPMAIALSGQLLMGQPVMVKPSEAEKNLVQSTASTGGSAGLAGPYGPVDRKLYVGNLHFNMTELQLRQIFEPFGTVELVQLPLDLETGHCKGFGFVQFAQVEHAKAAQSLNGKLEIAGRVIKVSSVTDHVGVQDTSTKSADFDDDDGGGLALNAHSRALLMQKLDRSGIATSIAGTLGTPALNGAPLGQQAVTLPFGGQVGIPGSVLPIQVLAPTVTEAIGSPSECLVMKNMFDPATETDPDFDQDIKDDVEEECSNFGRVKHIFVDKNSAGYVYIRFDTIEAAMKAQRAMHMRWFARRLVSALFMPAHEYDAKFKI